MLASMRDYDVPSPLGNLFAKHFLGGWLAVNDKGSFRWRRKTIEPGQDLALIGVRGQGVESFNLGTHLNLGLHDSDMLLSLQKPPSKGPVRLVAGEQNDRRGIG